MWSSWFIERWSDRAIYLFFWWAGSQRTPNDTVFMIPSVPNKKIIQNPTAVYYGSWINKTELHYIVLLPPIYCGFPWRWVSALVWMFSAVNHAFFGHPEPMLLSKSIDLTVWPKQLHEVTTRPTLHSINEKIIAASELFLFHPPSSNRSAQYSSRSELTYSVSIPRPSF